MMDESLDLTPPDSPQVSPLKQSICVLEDVPYFCCQGSNYLKSKHFSMIMNLNLKPISECVTRISRKHFSTHASLFSNLSSLFVDIKENYMCIKALTIDNLEYAGTGDKVALILNLRKNISSAFLFLFKCLQNFYQECSSLSLINPDPEQLTKKSDILIKLMIEVKSLLFIVGRLTNIPNITHVKDFNERSKTAEAFSHYFHMCLDMWWNSTILLKMISLFPLKVNKKELFCSELLQYEPWLQVLSIILSDFITLSFNQHECHHSLSNNLPFICKCVQELWIMSIIMLDGNKISNCDSFWAFLNQIILHFLKCESKEEISIYTFSLVSKQQNPDLIELCLWLTSYVSTLYWYDEWGNYDNMRIPKSGNAVVKHLINTILASKEIKEKSLHQSLFYCGQMISMWEPSCDIILPLTDFFIKRINETFLDKSDVNSLGFLHNTALVWYENIEKLTDLKVTYSKGRSFDLYLSMLCSLVTKSTDGSLWRSLKGRVYSKFMPKKFKEFSEIALQNSFTLFLAIVNAGHEDIVKETTDKIFELCSVIKTLSSPRKQMITWKALFVLMYIYQRKKRHINTIVNKVAVFFNEACLSYHKVQKDSMNKNLIMNLLMVYIDNMSELFEQTQKLTFSEYQLMDVDFNLLLSSCGTTELNFMFNIFLNILMKVQRTVSSKLETAVELQYVGFLKHFFTHVYPSVEKFSISNTPPLLIADIAALFINLVYHFSSSLDLTVPDYSSIFLNFASKDGVNCMFLCRFLNFVLDDSTLKDNLRCKLDFDEIIFQSWLKCIIHIYPSCNEVDALTSKVFVQKEILELFPELKKFNFTRGNHVYISIGLFQSMGVYFENCDSLQVKNNLKLKMQQYFKLFVSCVSERIKKQCDVLALSHVYKLTSHLVEYCSALLHVRYNPKSILPQLLDQIIFPHLVFPKDKTSQSVLSCSIKDHVHGFLKGLFKLNFTDDKCIEREIKNIIVTYINLYPLSNNPISQFYEDCVSGYPNKLNFLLDVLKNNVLLNNPGSEIGFSICFKLLKISPLNQKKEVSDILLKCAFEIYMKQTGPFSDFLFNLLQKEVFIYFKEGIGIIGSKAFLLPVVEWFIEEKLQWSIPRGFNLLTSITKCIPELMPKIVPVLSKTVLELEKKRGLGKDVLLREYLQNYINDQTKKSSKTYH